jgi:hypothetical protein
VEFTFSPANRPPPPTKNDCGYWGCTGVHDNNRYAELCPRSLDRKRARDSTYYASAKGMIARMAKRWEVPVAGLDAFFESAKANRAEVLTEVARGRGLDV